MGKASKRGDMLRLREIMNLLIEPFNSEDMEWLTDEQKLEKAFSIKTAPIYRRKILQSLPINGLWWMDEDQYTRWLWKGEDATVIKTDQDPDRVLTTRTFHKGSWAYIRQSGDRYDIESRTRSTIWDSKKRKSKGAYWEWMTVTVSKEQFKLLEPFFGPAEDGCRHEYRF